ncbi:phage tail tape measure protein, partial [Clostridium botulinum]|nr:phage tail tape measure protein [Clostridium botulinum]
QETKEAIAKKQSELEKLNSAEEVNEKAVNKATEQLEKMKATLHSTEQNITLTENEMKKLSNQIKETNSTLESHALDQYKQKMQDLGSGIQSAGDKMQKTGQVFSATGASLLKLSAPVVAFSAYAIKVGTDFEYAMKKVQATSGATQQELNVLTEKAKEMGATTKWSASDAADGLNYMAMAGWKTEQMVAGLEPIMNLATAAGTDLALTSDIVTDALTAFGLKAEDTGHFTDIIASASSNANTNVEMLGESFQYCAPVCGALGFT